jgi:hypothetical protein
MGSGYGSNISVHPTRDGGFQNVSDCKQSNLKVFNYTQISELYREKKEVLQDRHKMGTQK